jgi:DNA-binding NtrC family response regulator
MLETSPTIRLLLSGASPAVRTAREMVALVAQNRLPVLVTGEPGTRTIEMAREIHLASPYQAEPVAIIDCGSASTGFLSNDGMGKPMMTAVLKEIAALSPPCQAEVVEFLRGESRAMRIIACSESNLDEEVRAGRLREDVVQLVGAISIRVPALRYCSPDIPLVIERLVASYAELLGKDCPALGPTLIQFLQQLPWPGNIDQLEAAAKMITLLDDERVAIAAVRSAYTGNAPAKRNHFTSLKAAARAAERDLIVKVLASNHGNRKAAAGQLQISYKALLYKLKQFGVMSAPRGTQ